MLHGVGKQLRLALAILLSDFGSAVNSLPVNSRPHIFGVIMLKSCVLSVAVFVALSASTFAAERAVVLDPVAAAIAKNEQIQTLERARYQQYFQAAYLQYPQIPAGILESIAYTKTRWNNVQASKMYDDHHGFAQIFGVMGLYRGQPGYSDQVGDAAKLLGVSQEQVIRDQRLNILGAAALLANDMKARGIGKATPEMLGEVLQAAMGLSLSTQKSNVADHVRESFAYSVLNALDQGADDNGVRIQARKIAYEKAFPVQTLIEQRAPFVSLDVSKDQVIVESLGIDPISETLIDTQPKALAKSTDFGPALYQQSPYEGARINGNPTHISIHQMEGFYAGSISEFLTGSAQVSAHYLIRNSDGQVTQMVREARRANHTFKNNDYSLGIEQEGFKGQSNWYSNANYSSLIAIVKNMCSRWSIPCSSVYRGAATDTENVQATSLRIKGHQHFPDQGGNRSDPGRFFSWTRFADGIGGGSSPGVIDSFETSEGHFATAPTASGSTVGISTASTAERNNVRFKNGSWSEQIGLKDNTSTNADYFVRFLSGDGNPSQNTSLQKAGGRVGAWFFTAAPGVTISLTVDDSDGTEQSIAKAVPVNTWTFLEWKLDDQAEWDAWAGASNGTITAANVTLDAIIFKRVQNANDVFIYVDDVSFRIQ
jgi:N-acetyl-anhydromuramyl-L-alanine amidase AmpD